MRIKTLSEKAPEEVVPVLIDFKHLVSSIDSVVVTVSVRNGTDASPVDLIFGSAQIAGTEVSQLIKAGLDGVVYRVRMDVVSGDQQYAGAVYLPVVELL